jgi:hypothetical protein
VVVGSCALTPGRCRDRVIVQGVFGKVGLSVVLEDIEIVQENRSMGRELLSGPECT